MAATWERQNRNWFQNVLKLTLVLLLAACGGGGGGGGGGSNDPDPGGSGFGTVSGRVVDATNSDPIVGAIVRSGSITATTDASGQFTLTKVPTGARKVLSVNADNYAEGFQLAQVTGDATTTLSDLMLLPVEVSVDINVATGGTVTAPSGSQVQIPAAGLVRADGSAAAGTATVNLTTIDPTQSTELMPGDFTTPDGGTIESFGAINVSIKDEAGNALNLGSGKTSTVRIPVNSRNTDPDLTIPLFYFDADTGRWVQEGTATLQGTAPNQYYEGTVTHFSVWNADKVLETVYINGCVQNVDGEPVAGATVTTDGIEYSGSASATTNSQGEFRVAVKLGADAELSARKTGLGSSNSVTVNFSEDTTLDECLTFAQASSTSLKIKLTWRDSPEDLDSHLFTPSGHWVYYATKGSLTVAPYANLDVDDTDGHGPEIITINRLMVGTYTYAVHNYDEENPPGISGSPARVELTHGGTTRVFTPPAGEGLSDYLWVVFTITVEANCDVTVTAKNEYDSSEFEDLDFFPDSYPLTTTPQYCAPDS